jgi:hypothetical protein
MKTVQEWTNNLPCVDPSRPGDRIITAAGVAEIRDDTFNWVLDQFEAEGMDAVPGAEACSLEGRKAIGNYIRQLAALRQ